MSLKCSRCGCGEGRGFLAKVEVDCECRLGGGQAGGWRNLPIRMSFGVQIAGKAPSKWSAIPDYRITQHPLCFLWSPLSKLCLVAASKTSSTPSPVRDEHSRYFFAPMRLRTSSPSSDVRNFSERLRISSCATGSSRRSFLRPTRMIGTPGQRSSTSGCLILSSDRGHRKSGRFRHRTISL
jgi:hypothetical protein